MDEIEILWTEEIKNELDSLATKGIGTEEYKTMVDGITQLLDRKIEIEKLKEDRHDRLVKNVISCAGISLPLLITVWGTIVSLNFEKEGVVTTGVGRGFINKLFRLK